MVKATQEVRPLLINASELAVMLNIGERTLWRLLASGKLIDPVRIGGNTRWRVDEVEAWINAGCPSPETSENASGGNNRWHLSEN